MLHTSLTTKTAELLGSRLDDVVLLWVDGCAVQCLGVYELAPRGRRDDQSYIENECGNKYMRKRYLQPVPLSIPDEDAIDSIHIMERRKKILDKSEFYPTGRPTCKYAAEGCKRRNPEHFQEFAHPLDHPQVQQITSRQQKTSDLRNMFPAVEPAKPQNIAINAKRFSDFDLRGNDRGIIDPSDSISGSINRCKTQVTNLSESSSTSSGDSPKLNTVTLSGRQLLENSGYSNDSDYEERVNLFGVNIPVGSRISWKPYKEQFPSDDDFMDVDLYKKADMLSPATGYGPEHFLHNKVGPMRSSIMQERKLSSQEGETWNDEFQAVVESVRELSAPDTKQDKRQEVYQQLADLGRNFISAAKNYGKIIITEVHLDAKDKTIKPLEVAGGDKYFVQGIYFKFAVDSANLFGGDVGAIKVAGHELRSLTQVFNCWVKPLHVPMAVLVDYRGFRLIAMSTCPITESTIVYGAHNASGKCEVHMSDDSVKEKMERLGKILNLRKHIAGSEGLEICTPVDLEAHIGLDRKVYLLDFARLFPPIQPEPSIMSSFLVNLFRPEFVRTYPKPLCSDAFSSFLDRKQRIEINDDIRNATSSLLFSTVPKFASQLEEQKIEVSKKYPLIESLHHNGINVRYLGLLRAYLSKGIKYWRYIILIEMVSRTIKQMMQTKLREMAREVKTQGDVPYKKMIIRELNSIFGNRDESSAYWSHMIYNSLKRKFLISSEFVESFISKKPPGVYFPEHSRFELYSPNGKPAEFSLRDYIVRSSGKLGLVDGRSHLFSEVCKVMGLVMSVNAQQCFQFPSAFELRAPFDEVDLEDFSERVKHMNIVSHAEGFVLKLKAAKKLAPESGHLYSLAIDRFRKALSSNPDNKNSLRNLADCYEFVDASEEANIYYQRAIDCDPHDTYTLFKYACFLDKNERENPEEYYLQALEGDPNNASALCVYADWLAFTVNNEQAAEKVYEAAMRIGSASTSLLNNFGCLRLRQKRHFDAERLFKEAVNRREIHPVVYRNYTILLIELKRPKEAKETWNYYQQSRERIVRAQEQNLPLNDSNIWYQSTYKPNNLFASQPVKFNRLVDRKFHFNATGDFVTPSVSMQLLINNWVVAKQDQYYGPFPSPPAIVKAVYRSAAYYSVDHLPSEISNYVNGGSSSSIETTHRGGGTSSEGKGELMCLVAIILAFALSLDSIFE
ncbi:hypothetical protein PROFUN_04716 [Planoprotostelium fungivorum]|uniref:Clu domain-containing protein n=1 Tax=Planoprotostelium fungivorum TaxID=1890364 RepID=A0A2P6NFW4_9EUKA|nr:hypothetical protein PROFUN_04716 [Planoprotostelium fungivorum]